LSLSGNGGKKSGRRSQKEKIEEERTWRRYVGKKRGLGEKD